MRIKPIQKGAGLWSALFVAMVLAAMTPWVLAQEPPPPAAQAPAQQAPETPAAETPAVTACSDCHDQAKAFITNPHARGAIQKGDVPNDVCTTCHGDGAEHIEGGGDKAKINVPRGRAGADDTCLMCHETSSDRRSTRTGMHANSAAVNCLTCHSIHSSTARSTSLVAKPELELCGSCHTEAASFRTKPYAHRLDRGGMACSTCHEPHGRSSVSSRSLINTGHLRLSRAGEAPCLTCHTEKRGPFVYAHGSNEAGDCASCHEVHGSSNPKQLKRASVQQVCIECHSAIGMTTLGSQPPSFHNLSNPRYQNCTTCHVAIHGSNRDPQLLK